MSMHAVEIEARRKDNRPVSEEELEQIFLSLERNMALKSVNIAASTEGGSVSFMLGVECPDGLDVVSLVNGIVDDAVEKALGAAEQLHGFDQEIRSFRELTAC